MSVIRAAGGMVPFLGLYASFSLTSRFSYISLNLLPSSASWGALGVSGAFGACGDFGLSGDLGLLVLALLPEPADPPLLIKTMVP
jgi:hypothetical protein